MEGEWKIKVEMCKGDRGMCGQGGRKKMKLVENRGEQDGEERGGEGKKEIGRWKENGEGNLESNFSEEKLLALII